MLAADVYRVRIHQRGPAVQGLHAGAVEQLPINAVQARNLAGAVGFKHFPVQHGRFADPAKAMRFFKAFGELGGVAVEFFRDAAQVDARTAHFGHLSQADARTAHRLVDSWNLHGGDLAATPAHTLRQAFEAASNGPVTHVPAVLVAAARAGADQALAAAELDAARAEVDAKTTRNVDLRRQLLVVPGVRP